MFWERTRSLYWLEHGGSLLCGVLFGDLERYPDCNTCSRRGISLDPGTLLEKFRSRLAAAVATPRCLLGTTPTPNFSFHFLPDLFIFTCERIPLSGSNLLSTRC
jgi:hypothetical protein